MAHSPQDDTTCFNLKRDFSSFLSGSGPRHASFNKMGLHFSLDESNHHSSSQHPSSISMQSLIDKERQEKLKEAEFISANSRISELRSKIAQLETSNKKAKIEFERDLGTIRLESQKEVGKLSEYKERWQYLIEKEQEAKQQCKETRKELENCQTSYEQKVLKLQRDRLQLEEDLQQSQEAMRVKTMDMKSELLRQTTELDICKNELEETKAQLKQQLRRSSEATAQMKDLKEYKLKTLSAEMKAKELEQKIQHFEDDSVLVNSMKSQLTSLPELEKEIRTLKEKNAYLKDREENVALLDEQVRSLRSRLERADQRCVDMAKLQVENQELKQKIKKWELLDTEDSNHLSPVELKRQLSEAQNTQIMYLEKQGQLQSRIRSLEDMLQSKGDQQKSLTGQLTQVSSKSQQQTELIKRLQKKLLLISKERDAFKRILDSYESEMTINLDSHTGSRLQQQDQSLQVYQRQVEQLEEELQRKSELLTQERTRAQQLEVTLQESRNRSVLSQENKKHVHELRVKIAELESKLETVEEEKFILESRIEERHLQGDYDPTKTKVLHLRMNPAAFAQKERGEELSRLNEENGKLKARVKLLEESGGQVDDLTMMVDKDVQDSQTLNVNDLKAQITSAELKNKRLMEVFKKTSHEFREICYQLTGYKIDICHTNQYRLMSMYAESPGDFLLFQHSPSGEVQLLATEYSASLERLMEEYLQTQQSIPGFLSAITLDLLSHQTRTH